jgi:hypothetical protein
LTLIPVLSKCFHTQDLTGCIFFSACFEVFELFEAGIAIGVEFFQGVQSGARENAVFFSVIVQRLGYL